MDNDRHKLDEVDLSIVIPVYNHVKYLNHCIKSVLMQKTNFRIEVLVGDDCSTDGSRTLLKKWEKKVPSYWNFLYRDHNLGMTGNGDDLYARTRGRYLITIEGDDYWTYEYKLQKQYDFLENHPGYIAVAHHVCIVNENEERVSNGFDDRLFKTEYSIRDFCAGYLPGQTNTLMMRNFYRAKAFDSHLEPKDFPRDWKKAFLLVMNGRIRIIPRRWSSYRKVSDHGSSWSANNVVTQRELIGFLTSAIKHANRYVMSRRITQRLEGRMAYVKWSNSVRYGGQKICSVVDYVWSTSNPQLSTFVIASNITRRIRHYILFEHDACIFEKKGKIFGILTR